MSILLMMNNLAVWVIWSPGRVVEVQPDHCVILEWAAHGHLLLDSHSNCDEEAGLCIWWGGRYTFLGQISTFSRSDVIKYCRVGISKYDTV